MKKKGASLIEASLSLLAMTTIMLIIVPMAYSSALRVTNSMEVERFVRDAFLAMQIHYANYVEGSPNKCFNVAPSAVPVTQLISNDLLAPNWSEENFFRSGSAELTYQSNPNGIVDTMSITITSPSIIQRVNPSLPYLTEFTHSRLTFTKNIELSQSYLVRQNIDSSFCKGS